MKMDSLIPLAPRVFDLFDNNRDGTVDMRELLCGLSSLKNSQGDEALQICFQVLIHQHQLNPLIIQKKKKVQSLNLVLLVFQMYDTDRSGSISKEELASMLRVSSDNHHYHH